MIETKEKPAMNEIKTSKNVFKNLSTAALYEHAVSRKEAEITAGGALCAHTGKHTARSAQDKFIVKEPSSEGNIWWGDQNVAIDEAAFDKLYGKVQG